MADAHPVSGRQNRPGRGQAKPADVPLTDHEHLTTILVDELA
jgi:hypothetical protein